MLKKYSQFFESLLMFQDMVIVAVSWLASYALRFYLGPIPVWKGIPEFRQYAGLLVFILIIYLVVFRAYGLYRSMRFSSRIDEVFALVKASTLGLLVLVSLTFIFRQYEYSRGVFLYFWVIQTSVIIIARLSFRQGLRLMRKRGFNLRYILVVGAGEMGREIVSKIHARPELGLRVVGFLTRKTEKVGKFLEGVEVLGSYDDLPRILQSRNIDQVIVALPYDAHEKLEIVLKTLGDSMVDIRVVPDVYQFFTLRGGIEDFDGVPLISLQDTPLYGWNLVLKRLTDIVLSALILILTFPIMLIVALLIKLTSRGPVLYRQERMGLDGETFNIYKFRTMRVGAEDKTGPVWAKKGDPRRTSIGAFLRATSLDELPQFFNTLRGEMSIVGPRPERPVFIEDFRKKVPKYMLRHKMKAGITGLAQISGFRGNTPIEKRIEQDLYYIENWSLSLDFKIMALTIVRGFIHPQAY